MLDRNAILKEMDITQWVERDAAPVAVALEQKHEQKIESKAVIATPVVKAVVEAVMPKPEVSILKAVDVHAHEDLSSLAAAVTTCTGCALSKERIQTVFGMGAEQADWMLVGLAPGSHEEAQGKPIAGRAGQLLTQMLRALQMQREQVYISNALKCKLGKQGDSLADTLAKTWTACAPILQKQVALVQPKVMLVLGEKSAQALLNSTESLENLRGKVYYYGADKTPLIVTHHPAGILRKPEDKAEVWADLLLAYQQTAAIKR